jgi:iron(III) transport system substrate-binding protein
MRPFRKKPATVQKREIAMSIVSRRRWILAGLCAVVLAAGPAAAQAPMGNIRWQAHPLHVTAGAGCRAGRSPLSSGRTGVEVDVFRSGTTEVMGKLAAEFAAGAPKADVLLLADAATMEALKKDGGCCRIARRRSRA